MHKECCYDYLVNNMNDDLEEYEEEVLVCDVCGRYHRHYWNGSMRLTTVLNPKEVQEFLTRNQIEIIAILEAMKSLNASGKTKDIQIFTNSDYVEAGFNMNLGKWKQNGWKTAKKKPIKNKAQWKAVNQFLEYFPNTVIIKATEEANMDRAIALAKAQQREGILNGSIVPKTKKGY